MSAQGTGLLGEIHAQAPRKGPLCQMATVVANLAAKDRSELAQALADTSIATSAIFRALKNRGHNVNPSSVGKHRKGDCACGRDA